MDISSSDDVQQSIPPVDSQSTGSAQSQTTIDPNDVIPDQPAAIDPNDVITDADAYGGGEQQVKAGIEGALRGVLSAPIASAFETKALDIDPHAILARQEQNPWTAGLSEAGSFAGSAFIPVVGQAGLVGKVGVGATKVLGLGEAANVGAKLAQGAVKLGTEMAVLGGLDETSKLILNDPGQNSTTALQNIGLSTGIGMLTGGIFKGTGMLASATAKATGFADGMPQFLERLKARASGVNDNDLIVHELQDTDAKFNSMGNELRGPTGLKESTIAQGMVENTPENADKINTQVQNISNQIGDVIDTATTTADHPLKSSVPKLRYLQTQLQETVTNPNASFMDKWKALDTLKNGMQDFVKYGTSSEDSALGKTADSIAKTVRAGLEDSNVWGTAADIQKGVNAAWTTALDNGVKTGRNKFFTNGIADPAKIQSYLNQNGKSTTQTIRQQGLGTYVDAMDKFQNTVNALYQKAGITNPNEPLIMNTLKESLNKPNPWVKVADVWYDKQLSKLAGQTAGAVIGGALGHATGIPYAGYAGSILGEHIGDHVLPSIIQPMLESKFSSKAFMSASDMIKNIVNGNKLINNSVSNVFSNALKTIPQNINIKDTEHLDKQLIKLQNNSGNTAKEAINQHSYLPTHQAALNMTTVSAATWLNNQRPVDKKPNPLDTPIKPTPAEKLAFQHKLELAENPLSILDKVKNGSIQASDLLAINSMYPQLIPNIAQKVTAALIEHTSKGLTVPYATKMGLSLLLGQPMDSSMTPSSIIAAQMAGKSQQSQPQQPNSKMQNRKGTNSLGKSNNSYKTPSQAAESDRSDRE